MSYADYYNDKQPTHKQLTKGEVIERRVQKTCRQVKQRDVFLTLTVLLTCVVAYFFLFVLLYRLHILRKLRIFVYFLLQSLFLLCFQILWKLKKLYPFIVGIYIGVFLVYINYIFCSRLLIPKIRLLRHL